MLHYCYQKCFCRESRGQFSRFTMVNGNAMERYTIANSRSATIGDACQSKIEMGITIQGQRFWFMVDFDFPLRAVDRWFPLAVELNLLGQVKRQGRVKAIEQKSKTL